MVSVEIRSSLIKMTSLHRSFLCQILKRTLQEAICRAVSRHILKWQGQLKETRMEAGISPLGDETLKVSKSWFYNFTKYSTTA
ncbi:unnamed protein product [Caretta caretta]